MRFMRRLNSGMTRNCAAGQSLSRGAGIVLLSVPLRMRPDVSESVRQCLRFTLNACVPMQSSFRRIFHVIAPYLNLVREIFKSHTDLVEPLSLDEAYLDVTENKTGLPTATRVARAIREQIRQELHLTASAGVAPNKFLAKIASDWRKPDGLFVIQPDEVASFLPPLPVGRLPGVGKVTEARLQKLGILTVRDLQALELPALESAFGSHGLRLYELARGIDENPVVPDRPTQSVSAEDTFEYDLPLSETEPMIRQLAEKTWNASRKESRIARTVVLKLKTSEFKIITRSHTPERPPSSCGDLTSIALSLRDRVNLGSRQRFRLVGVGLSNFHEPEDAPPEPVLFG
jgi:DNA polymerase-4